MARFAVKLAIMGVMLIAIVLVMAWYDGGRETQRLIEQEVDVTEISE